MSAFSPFPDLPLYPVMGNHEAFPVNMFPESSGGGGHKFDPSWLYSAVAEDFKHWLPGKEQQDTIMELTRPMDTMEDLRSILEPHGVLQRLEERPYITIQHRINIRSSAQHFEFPRLFKSNNGS